MRIGRWIAKNRVLILIIGALLIVPSVIGFAGTRVNYDLLSYLPDSLETVNGQNIMVDEYGTGAFAMIVTEGMPLKDVEKAEEDKSCYGIPQMTSRYGQQSDPHAYHLIDHHTRRVFSPIRRQAIGCPDSQHIEEEHESQGRQLQLRVCQEAGHHVPKQRSQESACRARSQRTKANAKTTSDEGRQERSP